MFEDETQIKPKTQIKLVSVILGCSYLADVCAGVHQFGFCYFCQIYVHSNLEMLPALNVT